MVISQRIAVQSVSTSNTDVIFAMSLYIDLLIELLLWNLLGTPKQALSRPTSTQMLDYVLPVTICASNDLPYGSLAMFALGEQ